MNDDRKTLRNGTWWIVAAGALGLAATVGYALPAKADGDEGGKGVRNAIVFHIVDFIGWNNRNWEVMRHTHTADVHVEFEGQHTDGIDAHIGWMTQTIRAEPDARILQHTPIVADGDWTCTVGVLSSGGQMATVAKWREGAIAEEYLFFGAQPAGTPRPALSGPALTDIANRSPNAPLYHLAGAEEGWSCLSGRAASDGRRVAIFTQAPQGGSAAQELVFTEY
jgi:hypothetical protein